MTTNVSKKNFAFTLIELLIVIAIIAILSIVVVLTLSPGEMLRQARDNNRLSDMDTLTHALSLYQTDKATQGGALNLGLASTVYVSLPDASLSGNMTSTCGSLGLPLLPTGYSYQCTSPQGVRDSDGTGWLPVNFASITTGNPLGSLPIDPQNASSSRLYYTYTTNGSNYELTSSLESTKYKLGGTNDVVSSDGGTLSTVYEKGSKLGLEPLDYGDPNLVGYWTFDEGSGTIIRDQSGGGRNQSITMGAPVWITGRIGNFALQFGGNDATRWTSGFFPSYSALTMLVWINSASSTQNRYVSEFGNGSYVGSYLKQNADQIYIDLRNSSGTAACGVLFSPTNTITPGSWQLVGFTYDGSIETIYNNGNAISAQAASCALDTNSNFYTGWASTCGTNCGFAGAIDDVRIYNRSLSASEIAALYNGGK